MSADWASAIVALLSLSAAVFFSWRSNALAKANHALQRRLVDAQEEEKRLQRTSRFSIRTVRDFWSDGLSTPQIVARIFGLSYTCYEELDEADQGTMAGWRHVVEKVPDSWRFLVFEDRVIVGKWSIYALEDELFEKMKVGLIVPSEVPLSGFREMRAPGEYKVLFNDICVHPDFRELEQQAASRLLRRSIAETLGDLRNRGIVIKEVIAQAYTDVGRSLARAYNLQEISQSSYGPVYGAAIADVRLP